MFEFIPVREVKLCLFIFALRILMNKRALLKENRGWLSCSSIEDRQTGGTSVMACRMFSFLKILLSVQVFVVVFFFSHHWSVTWLGSKPNTWGDFASPVLVCRLHILEGGTFQSQVIRYAVVSEIWKTKWTAVAMKLWNQWRQQFLEIESLCYYFFK